jgi:hypothetical protein
MTYLQLVNSVLRRLREDEVDTVDQNSYSKLIGEYVNDAKRAVEDAWDWTALRTAITVTTSSSTYNYTLTGSQNRLKVLNVIDQTSNNFVLYRGTNWMDREYLVDPDPTGAPKYYAFKGVDASGDNKVDFYPKPDGVYSIDFNVVKRTADFTSDSETLAVPSSPVIQLATAFGARERGETGGTSAAEMFAIADTTLADAIALDAALHSEETIWNVV